MMIKELSLTASDQDPQLEEVVVVVRIRLEASIIVEARDSSREASDSRVEAGK